ncbi:MAG: GNAT family N-acetyltransferase, partial [Anaerolineales bacterium]|nr:GNAT family N-acetyltransferase [Anaerolineales bacterium]
MNIRKIDTENKSDVRRFIKFPFDLYKDNPYWVPPMMPDMKQALNRERHPFFKHSQADFFLAEEGKRVLGRIAAIDNQRYKEFTGQNTGFFYFFEVAEDIQVARALFNTAFDWARAQGLEHIIGPKGLAQGDGLGLLVEGFKYKPAMGIPYNPKFYKHFITDNGFEKSIDYLSGYFTTDYQIPERIHKLAERVQKRRGFKVKNFKSKDEVREWIPKIREVYNQAFATVPTFIPI